MAEPTVCEYCDMTHDPYRGCWPVEDAGRAATILGAADDGLVELRCNCGLPESDHADASGRSDYGHCPVFRWCGGDADRAAWTETLYPDAFA